MDVIKSASEAERDFNMEVSRLGYQRILDAVSSIEFTRDNIGQDLLLPARNILDALVEKKKEIKRPFLEANAKVDKVFNDIYKPLYQLIQTKQEEKKRVIDGINRERAAILAEANRKKELSQKVNGYLKKWAEIAYSAESKSTLDKLEQTINLAMGRPLEFKDLHEPFLEKCRDIKVIIAQQKVKVAELEKVVQEKQKAYETNDGDAYQKSLEAEVNIASQLRLQREDMLQKAFDSAVPMCAVQQFDTPQIKPSRRQWEWEITDMAKLAKKHPELVMLAPNEIAIREKLREFKNNGKDEIVMDGIRFFIDEKYK